MLSPFSILHFQCSTFGGGLFSVLPHLYFTQNVRFARICITFVVLTRFFLKWECQRFGEKKARNCAPAYDEPCT